jgi:hypothetical protein
VPRVSGSKVSANPSSKLLRGIWLVGEVEEKEGVEGTDLRKISGAVDQTGGTRGIS